MTSPDHEALKDRLILAGRRLKFVAENLFSPGEKRNVVLTDAEACYEAVEYITALRLESARDYYPSHEALSDLVHLLAEHEATGGGPGFEDRWAKALYVATDLVRVEP